MTASRATPEPVAPPPMTRTSRGLVAPAPISADRCTSLDGTAANGSWIFSRTVAMYDPPAPWSLTETGGERRMEEPYAVATAAPMAVPIRLRRVMESNEKREVRKEEREKCGPCFALYYLWSTSFNFKFTLLSGGTLIHLCSISKF